MRSLANLLSCAVLGASSVSAVRVMQPLRDEILQRAVTSVSVEERTVGQDRLPGIMVGYRAMSAEEFEAIENADGKLVYEYQGLGEPQLGEGVYTSPGLRDYGAPGDIVCAIVYDGDWSAFPKINVPQSYNDEDGDCVTLWWEPDDIETWFEQYHPTFTMDGSIRLSLISGTTKYQALLGPDIVTDNTFPVECCLYDDDECMDDLDGKYGDADYDTWGIVGGNPVS